MSFLTPEIIVTNPIPDETKIYYSKEDALLKAAGSLGLLGFGIDYLIVGTWIFGLAFTVAGAYYSFLKIRMLLTSKPQVIINKQGLQTADAPFATWEQVKGLNISGKLDTRGARPRLNYQHPQGKTSVRIDHLNISAHSFITLLTFYQHPWEFREYK
ncbi:hypothetical protein [Mucilaginibacter pedocola]|uniref:DUF304 domain-containing protein n=1 Tax=Mucilaginibacter pedocola TaxID=1792845 RepID=A0A1S9PH29_9SPHI|nr:hypothetical protein [Mucilaginibacter pedocola]OOQ60276.1 hypothetical protein BC343_26335 [Mucilaginibacter pedocola]